jgi:hypothetical protein
MLRGTAGWRSKGNDNIDLETDEFGGDGGEMVDRLVRPPYLKDDVMSLGIAEFGEALADALKAGARFRHSRGAAEHDAYPRDFECLLRARRDRRDRRACQDRKKFAASHRRQIQSF